jgi:uncharacterized GH25 family protein
MKLTLLATFAALYTSVACHAVQAHDTWVQTNTNIVRAGDAIFVDLMLGNHGNDHRDFKLAGKTDLETSTLEVITPDGSRFDLKERIVDNGYAPAEGFWSTRFVPTVPGSYLVAHTSDKVVTYAPLRSIKSGKTYFVVSPSLDRVPATYPLHDAPLGHALELVPTNNPVTPMGPGRPIAVQVLYHGAPLADARVSFIPRGVSLREGFDDLYERRADSQGRASFTPQEGNTYLVVVHHTDATAAGEGYKGTKYSATLTVFVPQLCPCCDTIGE